MQKNTGIILLFFCIAGILAAGCTDSTNAPQQIRIAKDTSIESNPLEITTMKTVATNSLESEPIIGEWKFYANYGDSLEIISIFDQNGNYSKSMKIGDMNMVPQHGIWKKIGENLYDVTTTNSIGIRYHYVPETGMIYPEDALNQKSTRLSTATFATINPETVLTGSNSFYLEGHGDDVQQFNMYGDKIRIFTISYSGSNNFTIWLKDSQGEKINLLVNKIGSYNGKKSERLGAGKYYLDVGSDGPWYVIITSI